MNEVVSSEALTLEKQEEFSLTARQIFDQLREGKIVRLSIPKYDAELLFSYLNVIKSREKKLWTSLGIEFDMMIIKLTFTSDYAIYELKKPDPKRRYPVFAIIDTDGKS